MSDPTGCLQTSVVAAYIASALHTPLPEDVAEKTRLHLLDTIAAIVSGTALAGGLAGTIAGNRGRGACGRPSGCPCKRHGRPRG